MRVSAEGILWYILKATMLFCSVQGIRKLTSCEPAYIKACIRSIYFVPQRSNWSMIMNHMHCIEAPFITCLQLLWYKRCCRPEAFQGALSKQQANCRWNLCIVDAPERLQRLSTAEVFPHSAWALQLCCTPIIWTVCRPICRRSPVTW